MGKIVLVSVAFSQILLFTAAFPANEISKIDYEGLRQIKPETLDEVIQIQLGFAASEDEIEEAIKAIYSLGYFHDVETEITTSAEGNTLFFRVSENLKIQRILIFGNALLSSREIRRNISVQIGDVMTNDIAGQISKEIDDLYRKAVFKQPNVAIELVELDDENARIDIIIEENQNILVKKVTITGNKRFRDLRLKLLMKTKVFRFSPFKKYYNAQIIKSDMNRLREYYVTHGFLNVQVEMANFDLSPDERSVKLVLKIQEGEQYSVGVIDILGNKLFSTEEILEASRIRSGDFLNFTITEKGLKKIAKLYSDEGYINNTYSFYIVRDDKAAKADLTISIHEKNKVYLANIKIEQIPKPDMENNFLLLSKLSDWLSPKTKLETIHREILLQPSDVYREYREVESENRLRRLQVFRKVSIQHKATADPDKADMIVKVMDTDTGRLNFGAGFGDVNGGFGVISISESNLGGSADRLNIMMQYGSGIKAFDISYFNRYIRKSNYSFNAAVFRDNYFRDGYDETRTGLNLGLGRYFMKDRNIHVNTRLSLEKVGLDPDDEDALVEELDDYVKSSLTLSITQDQRDDPLFPSKGFSYRVSAEAGKAEGKLLKIAGSYNYNREFWQKPILSLKIKAGILPFGADEVALPERFFIGGTDDLRGFEYRGIAPKDEGDETVAIGGSTKISMQTEVRYPFSDYLAGVLFLDAGSLGEDVGELGSPRLGTGVGIRVRSRYATFSLDFAKELNGKDEDDTQFIHFKISSGL